MNELKHACLIMAHTGFEQLQMLINQLDDYRNDLFVHIDKKVKVMPSLYAKRSQLYIITDRVDVRWGDVSQIEAEFRLFETAHAHGPYIIYHLLSGADFPIKSNDYIHRFIADRPDTEFVGFASKESRALEWNVCRYHLFTRHYKPQSLLCKVFWRLIRPLMEAVVNSLHHRPASQTLKKGAQWVSITGAFCAYLIEQKNELLAKYRHTYCCDEIFLQTALWNSPFRSRIYPKDDEFEGCVRLIDWNRGLPYLWGGEEADIQLIKNSSALFARKFDINKYPGIISRVRELIQSS